MTDEQLSAEIRDSNLTYLMLAQNLIRRDKASALFRLGTPEESADLIAQNAAQSGHHGVSPIHLKSEHF